MGQNTDSPVNSLVGIRQNAGMFTQLVSDGSVFVHEILSQAQ